MNYEKKYKDALERAKILIEKLESTHIKGFIYHIFPELKESEDEQSRKWILEYLYDGLRKSDEQFKGQFKTAIAWLEKQGEQPTDKIEPKFKVGDWIASNICNTEWLHIIDKDGKNYEVETSQGNTGVPSIAYVDSNYHIWTINDAKDGDVLWHSDTASNGIFIFKEIRHDGKVLCYCDYDSEDHFCTGEHHTCCWSDDKYIKPTTKEQSDLLFQKIKEAGYEWDAEKKDLEEIKPLHISEGFIKQVREVHEYPIATKESIRKALMSISTEEYEEIWKRAFGETYKEFVDKLLDN